MTLKFTEQNGEMTFVVRVVPRASRSEIVGEHDGALRVRLAAPPVDGAANAELIKTLAKYFGVPQREIAIMSGLTAKLKQVRIGATTSRNLVVLLQAVK